MTNREVIDFWEKSAEEDLKTAESLFAAKRYAHCLFFCHLLTEKILKGLIVKHTKKNSLPIHDLRRLSRDTGIIFSETQAGLLTEINEFNIRARYDDFKFRFYKKATPDFAREYFRKTKELYQWLKKKL
ncbi:MAG: HEPN domain-containing protein [bacterium]|nr:HEPN domain-containing protein [bacterium]